MWPIEASTMKPSPRYLAMVLLLAGDSTITSFLPVFALLGTVLLQKKCVIGLVPILA
ncbi:hypothetical protein D3C86_2255150 [compost metagenome]